ILSSEIPIGGWQEHNNFHPYQERIQKYSGWRPFVNSTTTNEIIYGYDFQRLSRDRFFVFGTAAALYLYNRSTQSVNTLGSGYTGSIADRWQSAVHNDKLIIVNEFTKPKLFD